MVDVIANRDISSEIAYKVGIVHQSPLEKGKIKWKVSHLDINQKSLKGAL